MFCLLPVLLVIGAATGRPDVCCHHSGERITPLASVISLPHVLPLERTRTRGLPDKRAASWLPFDPSRHIAHLHVDAAVIGRVFSSCVPPFRCCVLRT